MSLQLPWPPSLPRRPRNFTKHRQYRRPAPMTTLESPWTQSLQRDPKDFALAPSQRRHRQVDRIFRRRVSIREKSETIPLLCSPRFASVIFGSACCWCCLPLPLFWPFGACPFHLRSHCLQALSNKRSLPSPALTTCRKKRRRRPPCRRSLRPRLRHRPPPRWNSRQRHRHRKYRLPRPPNRSRVTRTKFAIYTSTSSLWDLIPVPPTASSARRRCVLSGSIRKCGPLPTQ